MEADPGRPAIDSSWPLGQIALVTCQHHLAAMIRHEAGARHADQPDALHEMRVAVRRLNATIRMFEEYLPKWAVSSRSALRPLLQALGATRDFDVQLAYLHEIEATLPASERSSLAPLQTLFEGDRARAHSQMLVVLDAPRTIRSMTKWSEHLRSARAGGRKNAVSVETFALEGIRLRHKRLRKAVKSLTADATAEEYHEVRARVKRLRYALDVFAPIYGAPALKMLRALTRLQTVLGDYQDAEVRSVRLANLATGQPQHLPGATLFAMGRIAEQNARLARNARGNVAREYRRVSGRRWKKLLSEMTTLAASVSATASTACSLHLQAGKVAPLPAGNEAKSEKAPQATSSNKSCE